MESETPIAIGLGRETDGVNCDHNRYHVGSQFGKQGELVEFTSLQKLQIPSRLVG